MADERLQVAIKHWAPRMIANGIDYNDLVRTTEAIEGWEDWLDVWVACAEVHRGLALEAQEAGRRESAGEAFLRAAVTYHFSKFVWVIDPDRNRRATELAVKAMYDGLALADPGAQRIEAQLGDGVIAGNLRRPSTGGGPVPLVLLLPGLDSTKEEFHRWETVFLRRGMATLSLDGPGQGETGFTLGIRPDYEVAVTGILDAVEGCEGLDMERIGAAGVSLGGHYVIRAGAFEPRLKAIAGISGPYQMAAGWEQAPAVTRDAFTYYSRATGEEEARERAAQLSLAGVAEQVRQPCLVITGKVDRVVPWEQTKRIADEVPGSQWVLYDEGTHVCNNIPYKYRPLVADWMRDRLA